MVSVPVIRVDLELPTHRSYHELEGMFRHPSRNLDHAIAAQWAQYKTEIENAARELKSLSKRNVDLLYIQQLDSHLMNIQQTLQALILRAKSHREGQNNAIPAAQPVPGQHIYPPAIPPHGHGMPMPQNNVPLPPNGMNTPTPKIKFAPKTVEPTQPPAAPIPLRRTSSSTPRPPMRRAQSLRS